MIFDLLAVGTTIGVEASRFFGARHDLVPPLAVGRENAGISRQMTVWRRYQRSDFFTKLLRLSWLVSVNMFLRLAHVDEICRLAR